MEATTPPVCDRLLPTTSERPAGAVVVEVAVALAVLHRVHLGVLGAAVALVAALAVRRGGLAVLLAAMRLLRARLRRLLGVAAAGVGAVVGRAAGVVFGVVAVIVRFAL